VSLSTRQYWSMKWMASTLLRDLVSHPLWVEAVQ
jgi:hypothetical protein